MEKRRAKWEVNAGSTGSIFRTVLKQRPDHSGVESLGGENSTRWRWKGGAE